MLRNVLNPVMAAMSSILLAATSKVGMPLSTPYPFSCNNSMEGTTTAGETAPRTKLKGRLWKPTYFFKQLMFCSQFSCGIVPLLSDNALCMSFSAEQKFIETCPKKLDWAQMQVSPLSVHHLKWIYQYKKKIHKAHSKQQENPQWVRNQEYSSQRQMRISERKHKPDGPALLQKTLYTFTGILTTHSRYSKLFHSSCTIS